MTKKQTSIQPNQPQRYGVIAVTMRKSRLLVIRRSAYVIAPRTICFPGGGIEPHESPQEALIREFREELGETIIPVREIWQSLTPWHVHLRWWVAKLPDEFHFKINLQEVESFEWLTFDELLSHPDLLQSNIPFLERFCCKDDNFWK